jgi:hypothetical protein
MCRISQLQVEVLNIPTELFPFHIPSRYNGIVSYSRSRSICPMPQSIYLSLLILHWNLCNLYNWESAVKYSNKRQREKRERSKEDQIKSRRHYYWKLCHG